MEAKTLLLIEDDLDLAEIIRTFFAKENLRVVHVTNAKAGLKKIEGGDVDVIVSDLNLPEQSGLDLLLELGRTRPTHPPVILVTVSQEVDVAVRAIDAGAYDFIVKPIHFPQLWISVQRALKLKDLVRENHELREESRARRDVLAQGIVVKSAAMESALDVAKRVSGSNASVLVTGESGVGKELVAKLIHQWSPRRAGPYVAINCSAIPENLLESELFGYAKGAFTGAMEKKPGLFEAAHRGTLFFDEIGDLDAALQAKLLRVLQERRIRRLGETHDRDVDVRVISATHKDLKREVREGRFREDLFFRLHVVPIAIPPLRERIDDILPLAQHFLEKFARENKKRVELTKGARATLSAYAWKGNVRELQNAIERAVVLATGEIIDADDLYLERDDADLRQALSGEGLGRAFGHVIGTSFLPLADIEKVYIDYVFEKNGRLRDSTAKILGIDRKTLYRKLREPTPGH